MFNSIVMSYLYYCIDDINLSSLPNNNNTCSSITLRITHFGCVSLTFRDHTVGTDNLFALTPANLHQCYMQNKLLTQFSIELLIKSCLVLIDLSMFLYTHTMLFTSGNISSYGCGDSWSKANVTKIPLKTSCTGCSKSQYAY